MAATAVPPFVTAAWLSENRAGVETVEVRMHPDAEATRREFEADHLPGALLVNLDHDLAAPPAPILGRHPLPKADQFARLLGRLGIEPTRPVVAYDAVNGALAARLVWMLRAVGQPAAVLSGGSSAWSGPTESGPQAAVEPIEVPVRPWPPERIADASDVSAAVADGVPVIDSRAAERFRGEVEPIDAVAGHIPGAVNLPFADHFGEAGELRTPSQIVDRFSQAGVSGLQDGAIVYCGSGVTACVTLLAAEYAGLGLGRLYVGSWSGWSTTPGAGIATGDR